MLETNIQESAPKNPSKIGLTLAIIVLAIVLAGGGYWIYQASADSVPPTLEAADSTLTGFIQKDINLKDVTPKFLAFDETDENLYETKKAQHVAAGKKPTPLTFTNENKGVHYIYSDKDTTFEELLRNLDPSSEAIALAVYNPIRNFWEITPNTYYIGTEIINVDQFKNHKVEAGRGIVVVSLRDSSIFDANNGTVMPKKNYPICEQRGKGWYNFAIKDTNELERCSRSFSSIWIQTDSNPVTYEKTTIEEIAADDLEYSLVWAKLKEVPQVEGSLQMQAPADFTETEADRPDEAETEADRPDEAETESESETEAETETETESAGMQMQTESELPENNSRTNPSVQTQTTVNISQQSRIPADFIVPEPVEVIDPIRQIDVRSFSFSIDRVAYERNGVVFGGQEDQYTIIIIDENGAAVPEENVEVRFLGNDEIEVVVNDVELAQNFFAEVYVENSAGESAFFKSANSPYSIDLNP